MELKINRGFVYELFDSIFNTKLSEVCLLSLNKVLSDYVVNNDLKCELKKISQNQGFIFNLQSLEKQKGYACNLLKQVVDNSTYNEIYSIVEKDNIASLNTHVKVGFKFFKIVDNIFILKYTKI